MSHDEQPSGQDIMNAIAELNKKLDSNTAELSALRKRIRALDSKFKDTTDELGSRVHELGRALDRLGSLDERLAFYQSALAMSQVQRQGPNVIPDRKYSIQGGYSVLEPPAALRRERPYRR